MTGALVPAAGEADAGGFPRLLGRASQAGAGTLCQQGLSFATGVIVARVLGAADYGLFNLARNVADAAGILARLGLDIGLQRHLGERAGAARAAGGALLARIRAVAAGVALLPALGVAAGIGAVLEARVWPYPEFAETLLGLLLVLPFATDLAVLGGAYRGVLRLGPPLLAEYVLLPAVRLAAIAVLFWAGWRLSAAVAGSMLATVAAFVVLARQARRDFPVAAPPPARWGEAFAVMRYSSVMSAAVLVTTLTASLDLMLLGHFAGAEATGQYALMKTLLLPMGLFGAVFGQGVGALVAARHAGGDRAGLAAVLALNARCIALCTAPLLALFLFWGADVAALFGPSFRLPHGVVAALALAQYLIVVLGPMGWALSMTGRHVAELAVLSLGLAAVAIVGAIAIPVWGQLGAALATLSAVAIAHGARLLRAARVAGRPPIGTDVLAITAAALGVGTLADFAASTLATGLPRTGAGASLFVLLYAVMAWRWLLHADERRQLAAASRSIAGRAAWRRP